MTSYNYQVGGSLTNNSPSYVERTADSQLYEALYKGEFCYVLNSRQMGKSSLLVRTKHRLQQEGFLCTTVDMTNIGSENITPAQWYKGVVADLWSGFNLLEAINLKSWWKEREDLSLLHRLSYFIAEILLVHCKQERLFIFIDEIDSILSLDFPVDDFFALIRSCYNQRAIDPEYNRITFAIFGVATPSDLIKDKKRTSFNIGQAIELQGFTLDKIQPLAQGLSFNKCQQKVILKEILAWTGGQPFLTQKLCKLVANERLDSLKADTEAAWLKNLVWQHIIHKWESQDEPEHLRTIRDRLLYNEQMAGRLLGIYQQILEGEVVSTDDSREQIELILSGLVINKQGSLQVKNKIYQAVFNFNWVGKQLAKLRPYSENITAWVAAKGQDEMHLLRGVDLQKALAWSENKQLSDIDYRFLGASQELAKQEIANYLAAEKQARLIEREKAQFALDSAKLANQLLADARKTAKRNSQKLRLGKHWITLIAGCLTLGIIMLRLTGLLQGMEWMLLDSLFQARSVAPKDSLITIITIDEIDIQQIGKFPLPDQIFVDAIKILNSDKPQVIGLDLYRDLPTEPGHQELIKLFETTENLIGIEKVVGNTVAPSPVLARFGRVALADQVLDGDGKIRRALLSVRLEKGTKLNLGLRLALHYLERQGITPKTMPNHQIHLGKAVIIPFKANDGGYVGADANGYQVLLNYHGTHQQFQTFSISDLLANRIPKEAISGRIILIGTTAQSLNDLFQTPFSSRVSGPPQLMPGVTIHANIASFIINAAISGRPMLRVWSKPIEYLWILFFSGLGAALSWQLISPRLIVIGVIFAEFLLIGIAYFAFLQGWWIPLLPPTIGLIITAVFLPIVASKQLEKIQLHQTVKLLISVSLEQPTAGQIALEYLKVSENLENQLLIEKIIVNSSLFQNI